MTIHLVLEKDIRSASRALVSALSGEITAAIPSARVEEIGSTAIPGSLTKGDVDLAVFVDQADFVDAAAALGDRYQVNDMEDIAFFASFKGMRGGLEFGIQLNTPQVVTFRFLEFRDALRASPDLVDDYNHVKEQARALPPDDYRARKNEFIEKVLNRQAVTGAKP